MPVNVGPCAVNRWPDLVMTHAVRAANLTATADADSHSRRCSNRKQLLLDMQRRSARHWARLQLGTLPGDENTELCTRWNTGQVDAASVASAADAMPELPEEVVNTDPENSNAEDGENRQYHTKCCYQLLIIVQSQCSLLHNMDVIVVSTPFVKWIGKVFLSCNRRSVCGRGSATSNVS